MVRSVREYWLLPPEQKARPVDFELSCMVTYFDPDWRMLFIQDEAGEPVYVPYGENPYPFRMGEAIVARGQFLPPSQDISFEHATITARAAWPLRPPDITKSVRDFSRHARRYVAAEGHVDWVRRTDERHLQVAIAVGSQSIAGWMQMKPEDPTPDLIDRRVRFEGVYNAKSGTDGRLQSLEILIPSLERLTVLGRIDDDPGFRLPVVPIGSLASQPPDRLVRVVGSVVAHEAGKYVRIRDSSGQVDLISGQVRPLSLNDTVEAFGRPVGEGLDWRLEDCLFRVRGKSLSPLYQQPDGAISLAAGVLSLPAAEAAAGRRVHLTGVVTWSHPNAPFFFIADSSGGIRVMRGASGSMVRSPGRNVEIDGVTAMGDFAPVVVASRFERVSDAVLPMARQVSVEHALTGVEEAQWVEMRGFLRRIHRIGAWNRLELATATSDFTALLPATEDVSGMVGSVIRLHGVCAAEADAQRKLTGVALWVPGIANVHVDEPAPADPFSVDLRPLASLGQFETVQSFNRRVRVAGTVVHHEPGHLLWMEDEGQGLLVLSESVQPLQAGDRVEAVGFLGRQGGRILLREAVLRRTAGGASPAARPIQPVVPPDPALDGRLVAVEGQLLDAARIADNLHLTMQVGEVVFSAVLNAGDAGPARLDTLGKGSHLRLAGVHEVTFDANGRATGFTLHLRSAEDLQVLEVPSWWTRGRILAMAGLFALGAVLFLGWNAVLRRQVRRQTGQIRAQMEREARLQAELARAGKLESLGLLAGGIAHDFNNLLTVLMGNISLAQMDAGLSADTSSSLDQAARAASRARDLTQQLLTFAKGGAPLRTAVSLPEVVQEVAEFAVRGSRVSCRFAFAPDLWPADVDRGQIGQVVQNIVLNAVQAMPGGGVVELQLSNHEVTGELAGVLAPGRYVRLEIGDHGPGIPAEDLARIFDPYFTTKKKGSGLGLATVHSIVKKHAGHITVDSRPGAGTVFRIWLPAAAAAPADEPVASAVVDGTERVAGARVLVMDDEAYIRDLAATILRRHGATVVTVADGAAAVQEYARARAAGEAYGLVILDLTIPGGMGGREALEELRRLDPAVRAIVSSGYSNDSVLADHAAHGFHGMVRKPYDVPALIGTVESVLAGPAG